MFYVSRYSKTSQLECKEHAVVGFISSVRGGTAPDLPGFPSLTLSCRPAVAWPLCKMPRCKIHLPAEMYVLYI